MNIGEFVTIPNFSRTRREVAMCQGVVISFLYGTHFVGRESKVAPPGKYLCRNAALVWSISPYPLLVIDLPVDPTTMFFGGKLPATAFREDDVVTTDTSLHGIKDEATVESIDYSHLTYHRDDGSPWPIYKVRFRDGSWAYAAEDSLRLKGRGQHW